MMRFAIGNSGIRNSAKVQNFRQGFNASPQGTPGKARALQGERGIYQRSAFMLLKSGDGY